MILGAEDRLASREAAFVGDAGDAQNLLGVAKLKELDLAQEEDDFDACQFSHRGLMNNAG